MEINLLHNENIKGIKINIEYEIFNEDVENIIKFLNDFKFKENRIIANKDDKLYFVNVDDAYIFFAENSSVFLLTENDKFTVKERLYELEERLGDKFIRISKSAIVNIDKIDSLEIEFNGKMKLYLKNSFVEFTSRNYLNEIKRKLGMNKK